MITDRGAAFLPALELEIQKRARNKDPNFVLSGPWKTFVRIQDGFKIFRVDEEWVKNNLDPVYTHGGHGFVHSAIPLDEIWVSTHHPKDCICKNVRPNRKMSENYFNRTVKHEIREFWKMAAGMIFELAHQEVLEEEKAEGCLDPYAEVEQ